MIAVKQALTRDEKHRRAFLTKLQTRIAGQAEVRA
jgi:hypothetical protein